MRTALYRGYWYAIWYEDGSIKRTSLRTRDREEAERRLIDLKRDLAAPKETATVGQIVQAYLDEKKDRIVDQPRLMHAWKQARAHFAHLRPDQVTREVCRSYISLRRQTGKKDATIIKEINTVRQALNWRFGKGKTDALFEAPPQPPPRERHLTRPEFRRLLDGCIQPHVKLFCILALATAGRMTAVLQLTWDRIDFERGKIRLARIGERQGKGRAVVPMTDKAREALQEAKTAARTPYVIEYGDKPVLSIKKGFAGAAKRAGLSDVSPHVLRHSAAVWMAEDGVSMAEIGQYLGHTDEKVTYRTYARFSPEHLRKAASALDY